MTISTHSLVIPLVMWALVTAVIPFEATNVSAAEPPHFLRDFAVGGGPAPSGLDGEHLTYMTGARTDENGKVWARNVLAIPPRDPSLGSDVFVEYPPLAEGDLLPMFGYLYRVTSVMDHGTASAKESEDAMLLEWVPDEQSPLNVSVDPTSFTVPLHRDGLGLGRLQATDVYVKEIAVSESDAHPATAQLQLIPFKPPRVTRTVRIRVGETLWLGPIGHQVRRIVPADPASQVVGWIELDPKPLPPARQNP